MYIRKKQPPQSIKRRKRPLKASIIKARARRKVKELLTHQSEDVRPATLGSDYRGKPAPNERCQHPIYRTAGYCWNRAIGLFDIPVDYAEPRKRHKATPALPRPKARLCIAHRARVRAHSEGKLENFNAGSHEANCPVCQHDDRRKVEQGWINWRLSMPAAAAELGVDERSFHNHVDYFDLWEKKQEKTNTKRALIQAAERGFAIKDDTVRTALLALQMIAKERGDAQNIQFKGLLGVADLSSLSDEELMKRTQELLKNMNEGDGEVLDAESEEVTG